jgi:type IX secretion system PorP/SprF family membrane protein
MKKTTNILVVFTLLLTGFVYGQQDPHYTQYMYNQNVLNPAYAGSRGDLSIGLLGRTQWVGIEGAPDTQTLNVHGALGRGLGLGMSVIHDEIGPIEETNLMLDLSYTLPVSERGKLAFGVKGSYNMLNNNLNSATSIIDASDPFFQEDYKNAYPNVGAGLYYYTDKFYLGLSVPGIMESFDYTTSNNNVQTDVSDKMHYFGTMGYVFDLSDNLKFKPSTMVKMVQGSPISLDLNGSLFINDMFEVGLSWRHQDSIDALIGVQASKNIRIGYAYDYTLTRLADFNSGSHELMLLFDLDFAKKHIKSPRFF